MTPSAATSVSIPAGGRSLRVLPRLHEDINEEWISDKTRFANDGPAAPAPGPSLSPARRSSGVDDVGRRLRRHRRSPEDHGRGPYRGHRRRHGLRRVHGRPEGSDDGPRVAPTSIAGRTARSWRPGSGLPICFNTMIAGIEEADACLLIGTNPRREAALVNARLRKRYLAGGFRVLSVGPDLDLTFPVARLGGGPEALAALAEGSLPASAELGDAARPMLVLGQGALARPDGFRRARRRAAHRRAVRHGARTTGTVFNVLHTAARPGGGPRPRPGPGRGGDGTCPASWKEPAMVTSRPCSCWARTRSTRMAWAMPSSSTSGITEMRARAGPTWFLPGAAYVEKDATWVNTEGRAQLGPAGRVFRPAMPARDWAVIRGPVGGRPAMRFPTTISSRSGRAWRTWRPWFGAPDEIWARAVGDVRSGWRDGPASVRESGLRLLHDRRHLPGVRDDGGL